MKRLLGVAIAALGTAAHAAVPAGVYTNLCRVAAADDLGGYTITLTYPEGRPKLELEECVGGCWSPPISRVAAIPDGISFVATEDSSKGKTAAVRYVAKLSNRMLVLTAPGHAEIERQHLKLSSDLNRRFDCEGPR
jgi:hypothetical protein